MDNGGPGRPPRRAHVVPDAGRGRETRNPGHPRRADPRRHPYGPQRRRARRASRRARREPALARPSHHRRCQRQGRRRQDADHDPAERDVRAARRAGVLAWDNNQTRGTLGWRTEQGPHDGTLLDLLPQAEQLLGTGAQAADLAHFVHHQTRDRFDVLRSKPVALAHEQRITPADVDAIHAVAAKYYRLIFIDSGNDESDPMWLRMIDLADQLVVATTTRADHAEAGALLLEDLAARDARSARLARDAVAVITQADPKATRSDMQHVANGYSALTRAAVMIPHDPALVDGQITYESLRPATQRAWLAAGAAVAGGLNGAPRG